MRWPKREKNTGRDVMTDLSPTTWDHAFFLQARSALSATIALESSVSDTCQQLHCLQMSIECLGKAYISRSSGTAPARRHDAFSLRAAEIPLAVLSKEDSELTQRLLRSFRAVQHFAIEIEGLNAAPESTSNTPGYSSMKFSRPSPSTLAKHFPAQNDCDSSTCSTIC